MTDGNRILRIHGLAAIRRKDLSKPFPVSGRQLARRDSSCLTAGERITESDMKALAEGSRLIAKVVYSDYE